MRNYGLITRFGILIIICSMTTACGFGRLSISKDEFNKSHNVVVIPYKPPPTKIEINNPVAVGLIFGFIGLTVNQALTGVERYKIADYLTKSAGSWNPSITAAEECLKILRKKSKAAIITLSISELGELPGADILRKEEPRTFTETDASWGSNWANVWSDFRNTNTSLLKYKEKHPEIKEDWALEVFNLATAFTDEFMLYGLYIKLMNTNTNEKIAAGFVAGEYSYPTLKKGYSFDDIKQIFTSVSENACSRILSDMGLIND